MDLLPKYIRTGLSEEEVAAEKKRKLDYDEGIQELLSHVATPTTVTISRKRRTEIIVDDKSTADGLTQESSHLTSSSTHAATGTTTGRVWTKVK